jgi:hypothetical protein
MYATPPLSKKWERRERPNIKEGNQQTPTKNLNL